MVAQVFAGKAPIPQGGLQPAIELNTRAGETQRKPLRAAEQYFGYAVFWLLTWQRLRIEYFRIIKLRICARTIPPRAFRFAPAPAPGVPVTQLVRENLAEQTQVPGPATVFSNGAGCCR